MSVEARSWARKVVVGNPTAKAVLCAIADYADSNGIAWPSQTSLAEDTEFSERAVRNAIQLLELKGLLATQMPAFVGTGSPRLVRGAENTRMSTRA